MAREKGTGKKTEIPRCSESLYLSHHRCAREEDPQKWGLWSQLRTPPAHGDPVTYLLLCPSMRHRLPFYLVEIRF